MPPGEQKRLYSRLLHALGGKSAVCPTVTSWAGGLLGEGGIPGANGARALSPSCAGWAPGQSPQPTAALTWQVTAPTTKCSFLEGVRAGGRGPAKMLGAGEGVGGSATRVKKRVTLRRGRTSRAGGCRREGAPDKLLHVLSFERRLPDLQHQSRRAHRLTARLGHKRNTPAPPAARPGDRASPAPHGGQGFGASPQPHSGTID